MSVPEAFVICTAIICATWIISLGMWWARGKP